ncbi:MAG: divalent metal cation transporter [Woeseiaceae bacterium]|nr:divalent metal cation transporter [Woeseiaceae bacterium]
MKGWIARLGPGLMLAAAAVGVSHLVQSTRAGADFGLSFVWLVVLISILKYPAFRFAVDYASLTNHSLVYAYSKMGRLPMYWLLVGFVVDMFIATAAVSLVTAGLLISVFDLPFSGPHVAIVVAVLSALVLLNGKYARAERLVKVLVFSFSVLAVIAMLLALPRLGSEGRELFAALTPSRSLAVFVIAIAGWMPMPMTGSIFISMWAREKKAAGGDAITHRSAVNDLRFGWVLTMVLAVSFMIMGTAILFQADRAVPASAGAFATELLAIFTAIIGDWSYPVIALAAVAVMWSTVLALMDILPRVTSRLVDCLRGYAEEPRTPYGAMLAVQVSGVTLIMLMLLGSFNTFIDFATSAGFITAPAIAYYNYRALMQARETTGYQPSRALVVWHWVGFAALAAFAIAFLVARFT